MNTTAVDGLLHITLCIKTRDPPELGWVGLFVYIGGSFG